MEMEDAAVPALAVVDARFCVAGAATLAVAKALSMSGNIFLASNDAEQACDFRITDSYHDGACAVNLGDSNTVIARAS